MVLPIGPWGGGAATFYQITNSLLFRGGQKLYKSFTSSSTWGLSVWVRRNALGAVNPILGSAVKFNASDTLTAGSLTTTAVYRDPTAWMHIAIAGGRLWVNGIDMGATTTSAFTCSATNCLGYDGTNYLNAEIAEFAFVDGTQSSSPPGRVDGVTGSWAPNPVSTAWGTNGAYLGKPWNSASLGTDYSGQGNTWTPSGFSTSDVLSDCPTNVYATLNPLFINASTSMGQFQDNGNLRFNGPASGHGATVATFPLPSSGGLFRMQVKVTNRGSSEFSVGIANADDYPASANCYFSYDHGGRWLSYGYGYRGNINQGPSDAAVQLGLAAYTSADVIDVVWDADNKSCAWYKNGVLQYTKTGLTTGRWVFGLGCYYDGVAEVNFGQQLWTYTIAGIKPLCSGSLPTTTAATSGSFIGNASADGPCVYTGAVPQTLTINGNAVTWGTHADKLATGFKIRTSSSSYNASGTNNWTATYSTPQKPTVGSNKVPSNAQGNQ